MLKALILTAVLIGVQGAGYPSDLPICHAGDTECLPRVITQTIKSVKNGRKDLGLPSIEPLRVERLDIKGEESSPVSINLNFRDLDVYGLSQAVVTRVVGFGPDPRNTKFELDVKLPKIQLVGKYKIDGKVLILPITGKGASNLTLDNVALRVKFIPKFFVRNGKTHAQTEKLKLLFDTTRLHMYFENLFNGNKALGDTMNVFLNENWKDIMNELKPAITDAFVTIISSIINAVFNKIAYDDIFEA